MVGIYTSSDGRQTMFQTFDENQYYLQSQLLRHGELAWLARNTYFGDQRNYLETHIDDNFLSDDAWNTATHSTDFNAADALREVPARHHHRRDVVAAEQLPHRHVVQRRRQRHVGRLDSLSVRATPVAARPAARVPPRARRLEHQALS